MGAATDLFVHVSNIALSLPSDPWKIVGLSVVGFVTSIVLLGLYNYFLHPIAHIKGPFLASFGPIWLLRSVAGHKFNPDIAALHQKYGPVVRVGPNELSFASEAALTDIHNHKAADFTKKGTSEELIFKLVFAAPNLLTVQDPVAHKALRATLQPAFTMKALLEQQEITQLYVQKMVDALMAVATKGPDETVSLADEAGKMLWGIVGDLCFGEPVSLKQWEGHEQMKAAHVKAAPILEFFQYLTELPIIGQMAYFTVVAARKVLGPTKNVLGRTELRGHITRQTGRKDFLTAIMGAKESAQLGPAEIFSNMLLLLMGGYDSTHTTISGLFYYLLHQPDLYRKLQAQLHQEYPSTRDIDCNSLARQQLLNGCINEALRLVPAINGHGSHRVAARGTTVDGVFVPRGTLVSADCYTMQRDPASWALPGEFRPERWSGGPGPGPGTTAYDKDARGMWRPFLVGPRVCIGREMALQSLRLAVARVVHAFDVTLVNTDFDWDRDAGSHFVWHDFDVVVKLAPTGKA